MTNPENLLEIQLHEIKPDTVIRIHTDYGQVIETPVKRKDFGWNVATVYPSNEPGTPGMVIRDSCKVYLVREDVEEPKHPGSVITVKYRSSDKEHTLVKVQDDSWYMSSSPCQDIRQRWWEILERCYDIKVVHEGYDPNHEWVEIPEFWDDLKDVPQFVNYLVDRGGEKLRRKTHHPDQWEWLDKNGLYAPYHYYNHFPYRLAPGHPLTNREQE